ncbi:MAG: terpene cyclase/mutase family protein [Kiritimatiellae bacterium]|nr:terpene cyclase/mutase family protein [Kiritimatiellia bacterium]
MNEEPEAPVEEARPDEEIDESERAYREMQKLFEELSFRERWRRMIAGLKMPHDTGEYKFARLQLQRLSGPAVAVAVPLITVIILLLLPRREIPPPVTAAVEIIEPPEEVEIEPPPEEPPPPPDTLEPNDSDIDGDPGDVTPVEEPAPVTDEPVSAKPKEISTVANVKSPIKMPGIFASRDPGQRGRQLGRFGVGGGDAIVMRALRWLKMQQKSDGSWGDESQFRTALTGMAILTYLAHNEVPAPDTEFGPTVERAIRFLVDSLGSGEYFRDKDGNNYSHPIGVYALGEAYAMTRNPLVKSAVERAVQPLIRGQNANNGWEYKMAQTARTDNSYSGWCAQAVKAVHASGIRVPGLDECYEKAKHAFDCVYRDGVFYYQNEGNGPNGHPAETAIATLCMQLLEQYADPKVKAAMAYMDACTYDFEQWENQPWGGGGNNPSPVYYWYYLTQAKFQVGGATFGAWNKMFYPELRDHQQIIKGEGGASGYTDLEGKYRDIGWWDSPSRGEAYRNNKGGLPCTWWQGGQQTQGSTSLDCRIMDTTLCALQLMVYYRFLPTSQQVDVSVRDAESVLGGPVVKKTDDVRIDVSRKRKM